MNARALPPFQLRAQAAHVTPPQHQHVSTSVQSVSVSPTPTDRSYRRKCKGQIQCCAATYRVSLQSRRLKSGIGLCALMLAYLSLELMRHNQSGGFTDLSTGVYVACNRDKPLSRRDICAPSLQTAFPPAGSSPSQGFSLFSSNTHTRARRFSQDFALTLLGSPTLLEQSQDKYL